MEIYEDMEQGSPEWYEARLGSIGGSSIAAVCAKGKGKMRMNLMFQLAGELLSGQKAENYTNKYMERGLEFEPQARDLYAETTGHEVRQVGLIQRRPFVHYSPDGIVVYGKWRGLLEIKTNIPSVFCRTVASDEVPPEYIKQIQWGLACGYDWCDYVAYCPEIRIRPYWVKRVHRDDKLIEEMDREADSFLADMLKIIKTVRGG